MLWPYLYNATLDALDEEDAAMKPHYSLRLRLDLPVFAEFVNVSAFANWLVHSQGEPV